MKNKLKIAGKRRAVIALLIFATVILSNNFRLFADWAPVNSPTGGLISQILIHKNYLISCAPGAGIFISKDDGGSWEQITKGINSLRLTTSITSDDYYIYAANINGGVFRTSDLGITWTQIQRGIDDLLNSQYTINKIKKIKTDLFICSSNGLYMSPDSGYTWFSKSSDLKGLSLNTYDVEWFHDTLFLGTQLGLYVSTDSAKSWPKVLLQGTESYYKIFLMNDKIYACYYDSQEDKKIFNEIFESSNGSQWSLYNPEMFMNSNILEFTEFNGKEIISSEKSDGANLITSVNISTNAGNNWSEIFSHSDKFVQNSHYLFTGLALTQNNIFLGTRYNGVLKKSYTGLNWDTKNTGLFNIQITALVSKGTNLLAGTIENGIFVSHDKGASWSLIQTSPSSNEKLFFKINNLKIDGTNIFATTSGGIFKSIDDGFSWVNLSLTSYNILDVISNNLNIYAIGNSQNGTSQVGHFFISTDFGNSWSIKDLPDNPIVYSFLELNSFFLLGTDNGILKTTDNGITWTNQAPQLNNVVKTVRSIVRSKTNILASSWDGINLSTDNGDTWKKSDNGLKNKVVHSLYTSGNYVFCASDSGAYISLDRGLSWNEINSGLKNYEIYGYAREGTVLYTYLLGDALYKSEIKEFFPIVINDISNSVLCADMEFQIPFSVKNYFTFYSGNVFSAELSDLNGDFSNQHIVIGSVNTTTSGVINVKIPKGLPFGTSYRIRIVSSDPQLIGSDETTDLTILNKSVPVITGENTVCAGVNTIYSTPENPGYSYKWMVTNGTIVGPDNNPQVNIIWSSSGNLKVRLENIKQCSDSNNIDIIVPPKPETPVITRQDTTLVSSSDTGNQWFLNGNVIAGETSKTLKPKVNGSYTVQVTNEFGCTSNISSSYNFEKDNDVLKIKVDNISGDAGNIINLNIRLVKNKSFSKYTIQSISVVLVLDASVLYPMDVASTLSENKRFIPLVFDTNYITDNIVKVIRLRAMLGDKVQSPLTLENIRITGDDVEIQSVAGTFSLTGLCYQGGPRLITSSGDIGIINIKPNPAQDEMQVDMQTNGDGIAKLYLLNTLGEVQRVFINEAVPTGLHTMNFSLKGISAGGYYLVLQSQSDRVVKELIIAK
jgi:photosystem II stability/assembly factor-like uncharacterized protein